VTYCWKVFDKGYNFTLNLILIKDLHAKLWGPKVAKVPTLVMSRLPKKMSFGCGACGEA
jgi:hypothetical protein